jgi:hypothetical protein
MHDAAQAGLEHTPSLSAGKSGPIIRDRTLSIRVRIVEGRSSNCLILELVAGHQVLHDFRLP